MSTKSVEIVEIPVTWDGGPAGRHRDSEAPAADVLCRRAVSRGELRPGSNAALVDEIVPAQMFMRAFALGDPLDAAFVDHLVDDIILPLLGACP